MNHYDRLNVHQDATLDAIKAAYDALVGKLHPALAQGEGDAGESPMAEQLAELDAAYAVLSSPESRAQYDAELFVEGITLDSRIGADAGDSRLDAAWAPAPAPSAVPARRTSFLLANRVWLLGACAAAALMAVTAWGTWQVLSRNAMEQALSDQYKTRPTPTLEDGTPDYAQSSLENPSTPVDSTQPPTVAELSRMSDEQLMNALPRLDEAPAPKVSQGRAAALYRHPLDGAPLVLRNEKTMIDPLAPEPLHP